nr:MAG: hypothetical protein [Picobirnavirus sp.]
MTSNQIRLNQYIEEKRHNVATEGIEGHKAISTRMQAEASKSQASTAASQQREVARHNLVDEDIRRGTLAVESGKLSETTRHNQASEQLQQQSINVEGRKAEYSREVGLTQAAYSREVGLANASAAMVGARAAASQAATAQLRQWEDKRHNLVSESISRSEAGAKIAQASASITSASAQSKQAETARSVSGSEKFKNYTSGIAAIAKAGSALAATILKIK